MSARKVVIHTRSYYGADHLRDGPRSRFYWLTPEVYAALRSAPQGQTVTFRAAEVRPDEADQDVLVIRGFICKTESDGLEERIEVQADSVHLE